MHHLDRLRRPPGGRRYKDGVDHCGIPRAGAGGVQAVRCRVPEGGCPGRLRGRGERRHRRRGAAPRPLLRGGLPRRGRLQRRDDRCRRPGRGAGDRRGDAVQPVAARRAHGPRVRGHRGADRLPTRRAEPLSPREGRMAFPPRLALATKNPGKVREILRICAGWPVRWLVYEDDDPRWPDVEETGDTYLANALLKARTVAEALGAPALADDSGIEVDALGGAPGPRSARFAAERASDEENLRLLIERIRGVPAERRTARYRCVAACVWPG